MNKDTMCSKSVDADEPDVIRLISHGWKHQGNDLWLGSPEEWVSMRKPVKRKTALRLCEIVDEIDEAEHE